MCLAGEEFKTKSKNDGNYQESIQSSFTRTLSVFDEI